MYYNAETERALRSLDEMAQQNREVIQRLSPPVANDIEWSVSEGRWVNKN